MTTSLVSATYSQAATANFQAWINEIYTALVTTCGLTQSADTGQMAVPTTATLPGAANTSAGFYMFQFNDTLQATAPVFIRLDFGTGTSVPAPSILVQVGTGTNGAGTLTGRVTLQQQATSNSAIQNPGITTYNSRYCYNATQGFLGVVWKTGSTTSLGNIAMAGLYVFRSVGASGATTADSIQVLVSSSGSSNGTTGNAGNMQVIDNNIPTVYSGGSNPLLSQTTWNAISPFGNSASLVGTTGQVFPCWQLANTLSQAAIGITNALAMAFISEIPIGTTTNINILGSTTLTYMSAGQPFGSSVGLGGTTYTLMMIWQ